MNICLPQLLPPLRLNGNGVVGKGQLIKRVSLYVSQSHEDASSSKSPGQWIFTHACFQKNHLEMKRFFWEGSKSTYWFFVISNDWMTFPPSSEVSILSSSLESECMYLNKRGRAAEFLQNDCTILDISKVQLGLFNQSSVRFSQTKLFQMSFEEVTAILKLMQNLQNTEHTWWFLFLEVSSIL